MRLMNPTLDQYIAELLYDYDCVIVPQLGGFVSNYRPARIDARKGLASPPGKDIRFNRNLTKNDGLLTSACADANGWSFEEAGTFVRKEVERTISQLNEGAKVKLKKVGILYIDAQKNIRFEPDTTQSFLKQSFGFETFALPEPIVQKAPVQEAKVLPINAPEPALAEIEQSTPAADYGRSEHTKSIYWVAAATLLPFIGFSLFLGIQTGFKSPGEFTTADLNPFSSKPAVERLYHPRATDELPSAIKPRAAAFPEGVNTFPFSFAESRVDSTAVWVNLAKAERTNDAATASKTVETVLGTYHIIAGCFGEKANAEKYVAELQESGHNASILDLNKGLYRVRLESHDVYTEATDRLQEVRKMRKHEGAWLLKKPLKP